VEANGRDKDRRGDAEILARPQARTALDELALPGIGPGLIGQDRQLLAQQSEDLQHLDRSAWAVTSTWGPLAVARAGPVGG
jgi:hypothetical protein